MKYIEEAGELKGKKVLLRTDLDVPVGDENLIGEDFRIARQQVMVQYLLSRGARVLMVAHISAVPSFEPLINQFQRLLGAQMSLCRDFDEVADYWNGDGSLALLENVRSNPGEKDNDAAFAGQLVAGCDLYVNNDFAVCHREHASVVSAPLMVPSYGGLLIREETQQLTRVLSSPAAGKLVIMGGAKASTKIPVIHGMIDRAEHVAIGGVIANVMFKELGMDIGDSRVDEDVHALLQGLNLHDPKLVLPTDSVKDGTQIMDMGPKSVKAVVALASQATLIVWNGPVGKFQDARFMSGTEAVAHAVAESPAVSLIGGGDTITAVHQLGLLDTFDFVSTGGGAMLAFLAGQQLPGLKVLGYYETPAQ